MSRDKHVSKKLNEQKMSTWSAKANTKTKETVLCTGSHS